MKTWFNLWCFFLFSLAVFSQNTYEPGYIITTAGDTLAGLILEKTDAAMAHRIRYKPTGDGAIQHFKAIDLAGFGFLNERTFEQMPVRVLREKVWDTTYVFAKHILKGKIDLLTWRHPQMVKPDFFVHNHVTGETAHLQKPAKREQVIDGKTYVVRDDRYIGYLNLIKMDSITSIVSEPVKYSEKHIFEDILEYNEAHETSFPIKKYSEKIERSTLILAGLPYSSNQDGLHFRAGIYRQKKYPERFSNFSLYKGIVYHHWGNENQELPTFKNGTSNYRWQFLNIIPIGINFHGDLGIFRPYGYAGLGGGVLMLTNRVIEDRVHTGNETQFMFLPTLNSGIGLKVKTGNSFIVTELTPTINNIFLNLGYMF